MHFGHHDSQFSWLRNNLQYVYYFLKITSWCNIFNSPIILGLSLPVRCVSMSEKLSCLTGCCLWSQVLPTLCSPTPAESKANTRRCCSQEMGRDPALCLFLPLICFSLFFHHLVCWELKFFQDVADTVWQWLGPLHFSCNQITSWQIRVHRGLCLLGKGCSVYSPSLLHLEMHQMLWAPLSVPRTNCLLCAGGSSS